MYIVSLASRCCQGINPTVSDSTKKTKSLVSSMLLSSHKNQLPRSVSTTKTQTGSQMHSSTKKATGVASVVKGRYSLKFSVQVRYTSPSYCIYNQFHWYIIFFSLPEGNCLMKQFSQLNPRRCLKRYSLSYFCNGYQAIIVMLIFWANQIGSKVKSRY